MDEVRTTTRMMYLSSWTLCKARCPNLNLTNLIDIINSSSPDEKISCVIADITMGWISETAGKMGAEFVVFSPPSAAALAVISHIPKLLEKGIPDQNVNIIDYYG
ncbi:hypothetical protein C2S53_000654 [Perilla frutescens var. hirtella]|uniref:Uncharacterized protein n=1 Tax=Perilla frutescens var. hirtella TaxID=608512 RepID=A0AAD4J0L3_PERFH|nr:hypothetical protein C2S53_000654 [Perilla frutescens var. hirtella]